MEIELIVLRQLVFERFDAGKAGYWNPKRQIRSKHAFFQDIIIVAKLSLKVGFQKLLV